MLAVSRTHYLRPHRPADFVCRGTGVSEMCSASGEPSARSALLAHLAGLALGAALVLVTTAVVALGLSMALP